MNDNDRELLELSAKGAGLSIEPHPNRRILNGLHFVHKGRNWNPLADDGDALRIAVKLTLEIDICLTGIAVRTPQGHKIIVDYEDVNDIFAATRLAIVRAAAEIGKMRILESSESS